MKNKRPEYQYSKKDTIKEIVFCIMVVITVVLAACLLG